MRRYPFTVTHSDIVSAVILPMDIPNMGDRSGLSRIKFDFKTESGIPSHDFTRFHTDHPCDQKQHCESSHPFCWEPGRLRNGASPRFAKRRWSVQILTRSPWETDRQPIKCTTELALDSMAAGDHGVGPAWLNERQSISFRFARQSPALRSWSGSPLVAGR
jgi:hypothetical protein